MPRAHRIGGSIGSRTGHGVICSALPTYRRLSPERQGVLAGGEPHFILTFKNTFSVRLDARSAGYLLRQPDWLHRTEISNDAGMRPGPRQAARSVALSKEREEHVGAVERVIR